jgi:hypothetical protein
MTAALELGLDFSFGFISLFFEGLVFRARFLPSNRLLLAQPAETPDLRLLGFDMLLKTRSIPRSILPTQQSQTLRPPES